MRQEVRALVLAAKDHPSTLMYSLGNETNSGADTPEAWSFINELAEYKPTHVISFVGRTHGTIGDRVYSTIDYLEQDDKLSENLRDNLAAPLLIAYLCKYAGIHYTYLGTGCIFSYREGDDAARALNYDSDPAASGSIEQCYKFKECDAPNFFGSSYSIVKGVTDRIMQERNCICESVLNLRIRMPIVARDNPRNFITKIAGYDKVCSLPNSMTVLDEFLPYALVLMKHRYTGTVNFVNPGVISHNEILGMYRSHVNPAFKWTNFTVEEQNAVLASKRSNNYLDNAKLLSLFPKARHIYDAVQHCLRTYNAGAGAGAGTNNDDSLDLTAIECTLWSRLKPTVGDGGDDDDAGANNGDAAGFRGVGTVELAAAAGLRAVQSAATYAGQCTRILSESVGELYTKMLATKHRATFFTQRRNQPHEMTALAKNISRIDDVGHVETVLRDVPETVICVTGGAGFIGSQFINYVWHKYSRIRIVNIDCLYYCANVTNIDSRIRNNSHIRDNNAPPSLQVEPSDADADADADAKSAGKPSRYVFKNFNLAGISAASDMLEMFQKERVTHVVHFAAQSHVQNSFGESLQYTQDNVVGTHNLLEAARQYAKLSLFIHVSTDEVYGESMLNADERHKTEQSVLCPTNPYAATKAAAELIAQSYYHSFKLPLIITRGNNVFGPNQYPEKLIPKFIQCLREGRKLPIQGDGSQLRSFVHVSDVCRAFDVIINRGKVGEIYNIGSNEAIEYSVIDVAKLLIKLIKGVNIGDATQENVSDVDWIEYIEDRPFNDRRYYISSEKLNRLGWRAQIDFESGLAAMLK
ncbi:MAG: NAD-dependent epimerase/dehydratase family protein [Planctomycetes bacterium]|nr:NAD-dependent epimerase/dehydratase family protein [Planctomycetota bacterium]